LSSGYYYLRARYYAPEIGRFISEDSYTGEISDPLSLNLYTYCVNDSVNNVDPSGHMDEAVRIDHFTYNRQLQFSTSINKYIYDQKVGEAAVIKFGNYFASYNGCGIVATYNVLRFMKYTAYDIHPAHITSYYEKNEILSGALGIPSGQIAAYFRLKGFKVTFTFRKLGTKEDFARLDRTAVHSKASIILTMPKPSAHYIALRYYPNLKNETRFQALNIVSGTSVATSFWSLKDLETKFQYTIAFMMSFT